MKPMLGNTCDLCPEFLLKLFHFLYSCHGIFSGLLPPGEADCIRILRNTVLLTGCKRRSGITSGTECSIFTVPAFCPYHPLPEPANLAEQLKEQGYLIRSCANYHNLGPGYYRVAVKTRVLNRGLIKAIKEVKQDALLTDFN